MTIIDVSSDKVELFGQTLFRPSDVSPTQWYQYWEVINGTEPITIEREEGYELVRVPDYLPD